MLLSFCKNSQCLKVDNLQCVTVNNFLTSTAQAVRLFSPLDCKQIQPVHPKRNQSRMAIGRTDAEAGTPILWPPDAKNGLTGKDPDAGKD